MKEKIFFVMAMVAITSCQSIDLGEGMSVDASTSTTNTQTKGVTFQMKGITEEFTSKATVTEAGCTDLWIWQGDTLLCHKVSTDTDFDAPVVSLTYGTHSLTFLASSSKEQTWTDGLWSTTKVGDIFGTTMTVTVSSSSSNTRQVQLTRRSSRIKFVSTDLVPTTVTQCHIKVSSHKSLDRNLNGSDSYTYEGTIDMTSKQGKTYSVQANVLTASPTDEENCDVTIEFLDSTDKTLYTYDRTLNLKPNRCVTLTGEYFFGATNAIVISSTAFDEVTQDLFTE